MPTFTTLVDAVLDQSADRAVGALLFAAAAALIVTTVHAALRKITHGSPAVLGLTCFGANVASMLLVLALASGPQCIDSVTNLPDRPGVHVPPSAQLPGAGEAAGPARSDAPRPSAAPLLLALGDLDGDGRLSPEEAGDAVEGFVREATAGVPGGSLDAEGIDHALFRHLGPNPWSATAGGGRL